jgi:hypothetical protein
MTLLRHGSLLLFAALALASPASGQESAATPDSVTPQLGRIIEQLHVGPDVEQTWRRVVSCAGEHADRQKDLSQVIFVLRTPGKRGPSGKLTKAEYVRPDTIFITQGYEHSGWIVAHELLHFALNGPPDSLYGTSHPYVPFAYPCGLYNDPTSDLPDEQLARDTGDREQATALVGGPHFAYPVLGYAVYIQGTLLAGHGWWRA